MGKEPEKINPFADEAAVNAAAEALKQLEWERALKVREAHIEACEVIMKTAVMPRVELAAEAMREWGNTAEVTGVARTETYSGTAHLRVKIMLNSGTDQASRLEFIASPKSMVIAVEGERGHDKRRWQKISLTSEAISGKCDECLSQFLTWGCAKTEE